jgi:hypothetical protein
MNIKANCIQSSKDSIRKELDKKEPSPIKKEGVQAPLEDNKT